MVTLLTGNSESVLLTSSCPVAPYLKAIESRIALTSHLHNLLHSQCYAILGSANRAAILKRNEQSESQPLTWMNICSCML